ncbi:hypothetical protein K469DRAFT_608427 [Zopfia rhizophila CBS 207.26]|uniref:HTH psq-type domain-containing protein n=1 Tax=Zopfia rhizophila CBS 207.26 TaxID=1314779 RepID=A0A6A6DEP4_9PEZI|nr:hypothetical protein K469DRAFT_608427 [Zopfia rhizophila CBS 207.26]
MTFYRNYAQIKERITFALAVINGIENPNIAAVARDFAVPYNQLLKRYKGRNSRSTRPITNSRLNAAQKATVKAYIPRCDKLGMPALIPQLKNAMQYILDLTHPNSLAPPLGKDFITR